MRERKAKQPKTKASTPGTSTTISAANAEVVEPYQYQGSLPVEEDHEIGQDRIA